MTLGKSRPMTATFPLSRPSLAPACRVSRLDGNYWWRNVREPVQFRTAVLAAAELGARYFVEIGPRPTLLKHITDSLHGEVNGCSTYAVLDRSDEDGDPFDKARAHAMVAGARIDIGKIFGPDPGPAVQLPTYPWQQMPFRFKPTVEAICGQTERHPFSRRAPNPRQPDLAFLDRHDAFPRACRPQTRRANHFSRHRFPRNRAGGGAANG